MDNSSNLKGYSVNYETVCEIEDAIRDKIYSLDQYKEDQSKRFKTRNNEISNNNFNYMDNSQEDDFELLARLTRER